MTIGQTWNTAAYAEHGRFVATLGNAVLDLLAPQPGERILDLGCGDGALTEQIAVTGARAVGIDASPEMVAAALARGLTVDHGSAAALSYEDEFDAVFSNAALHWIPDAQAVLQGVHRALRPGGRFVAEMGGQGNIAAIRTALQVVLAGYGVDAEATAASFFPSAAAYRRLLEENGFVVVSINLIPRPTPLPGGADGMAIWLNTFRNGVLDLLSPADREQAVSRTVDLLRPILADADGQWTADYVRLRFHAIRRQLTSAKGHLMLTPFHIAFPVDDLEAARQFYGTTLGCPEGRSSAHWIDFDLFGHQIVAHLKPRSAEATHSNPVDGHDVPVPHFGVVLTMERWQALADRLRAAGTKFVIEPYIRFQGEPGEQATMFFLDPAGNALEFKAFADLGQLFAK